MSAPSRKKGKSQYSPNKNYYHISFAGECQLCFETCNKPRRLPCEHEFCKDCLSDYFERNIPNEDPNTFFPCPSCNKSTNKPSLPRSKWTKAFKLDKRTLFYTGELLSIEENNNSEKNSSKSMVVKGSTSDTGVVRRRATTHDKPMGKIHVPQKRSGVHFAGVHNDCPSFNTKISKDENDCVYWGGAILSTGQVVLPDYYNYCIKVFTIYGNYICHAKVRYRPYDVAEIDNGTIVVTYGAHEKYVTFLTFNKTELMYSASIQIDGHLYCVARRGNQCMGIFESLDGNVKIARISNGGYLQTRDPGELSVFLSTGSHVQYYEKENMYFFTEKRNILGVDAAFNIRFVKSFPYLDTDHYMLGSITLDSAGTIFVTSDSCLLQIDTDGNKTRGPIPTLDSMEPFHIMATSDGTKIILVGRNNRVIVYMPPQA